MKRAILILILATVASVASAQQLEIGYVKRVLDGDTFYICKDIRGANCKIHRVNNLNTPEKRLCRPRIVNDGSCEHCVAGSKLGLEASKFAERLFAQDPQVRLSRLLLDRYGRVVSDIYLPDGRSYAQIVVDIGLGVHYPCKHGRCGARPRPWCE